MTLPAKEALRDELVAQVRADLDVLQRAHLAAREAATHEEARPEDDKDTRALEQSYLARGQARRVEELSEGLAAVQRMPVRDFAAEQPIGLGALVVTDDEEVGRQLFFVAPFGGGARLGGGKIQVVTPRSPLGLALMEKRVGDDCEVVLAGRTRELVVETVR